MQVPSRLLTRARVVLSAAMGLAASTNAQARRLVRLWRATRPGEDLWSGLWISSHQQRDSLHGTARAGALRWRWPPTRPIA